jgi:hypothetical protein
MKNRVRLAVCSAVVLALAGCSTTASRIRERQAVFDSYPEPIQHNLRRGIIEVGYTPEMVFIALGEPDRKVEVATEDGVSQVWTWWKSSPGVALGLGSWSRLGSHVGFGTGISVGDRARREEKAVVEFRRGRVRRFQTLAPG